MTEWTTNIEINGVSFELTLKRGLLPWSLDVVFVPPDKFTAGVWRGMWYGVPNGWKALHRAKADIGRAVKRADADWTGWKRSA